MKQHIPNALTAANLFFGLLSVRAVFLGRHEETALWMSLSVLMDFLDGGIARLLRVHSPIGKQLDSLADVVSFGVVPGLILARMIDASLGSMLFAGGTGAGFPYYLAGLLVPVFSALRLARFNVDERQQQVFYGVPTPANAAVVLSLWHWSQAPDAWIARWLHEPVLLIALSLLACGWLVADLRLIALKFTGYGWTGNQYRYLFMGGTALLMGWLGIRGILPAFGWYLLLSAAENLASARAEAAPKRDI
jgi:CDP-diacylglycerol--serine O-phosphatidyltransferase